jgi:hypothetical protein
MNLDRIFDTFNQHGVAYLLIGGMNFMLRHQPILTFDVDLWIDDRDDNRARCELALAALDAEWGDTDTTWEPVANKPAGWLARTVPGLGGWQSSFQTAIAEATSSGIRYYGISDEDMLRCQLALDAALQKTSRMQVLQSKLRGTP